MVFWFSMKGKQVKPIYVIAGKQQSLVNQACQKLLDELMPSEQRQQGLFTLDPEQLTPAELLDEVKTAGFLTDRKVVLLKNADSFISAHRETLEKYFDNPAGGSILIFTVKTWQSNTRLAKKLSKTGELISISEPKGKNLNSYVADYAANEHNKQLTPAACELLVMLAGAKPGLLTGEIDKLAAYVGDKEKIEPADVEALSAGSTMLNVFEVIDLMTAGKTERAVSRLRTIFAEDKSAEYTIVGAFAYYFRKMFDAKVLLSRGVSPSQTAGKLRIWKNKREFFNAVGNLELKQIGGYISGLAETDYRIKTGRARAQTAIEQLVFEVSLKAQKQQKR